MNKIAQFIRGERLLINPRIKIITGHFGSGKTEIAINLALAERNKFSKVAIADLDVVNPYFRSRDEREFLAESGVTLIAPEGKLSTSDLPIVSGAIYGVINDIEYRLIIDVGGDQDGATALGQYYNDLQRTDYQMYFVINANRPLVNDLAGVVDAISRIENASRLKVSGLINNTNLGADTKSRDIIKGIELSEAVSAKLNIPFLYTTINEEFISTTREIADINKVFYIRKYLKLPWE